MSSLASVFVANAKATPENVVPYGLSARVGNRYSVQAYEIDSDNQLSLTPLTAFYFCSSIQGVSTTAMRHWLLSVPIRLLTLRWVAWRSRLLVHWLLSWMSVLHTCVYRWWHRATSALSSLLCLMIRRRLAVHGICGLSIRGVLCPKVDCGLWRSRWWSSRRRRIGVCLIRRVRGQVERRGPVECWRRRTDTGGAGRRKDVSGTVRFSFTSEQIAKSARRHR